MTSPLRLLLTTFSVFSLSAYASTIQFGGDNDVAFQTDGDYSNGIFMAYNTTTEDLTANSWLPFALDKNYQKHWHTTLGQKIWTPSDIKAVEPKANERPYAGLLFLDAGLTVSSESRSHTLSVMLGTTGPDSGAEQAQIRVHRLLNNDKPQGWDYQVKNHIVADVSYGLDELIYRSSHSRLKHELSGYGRLVAGNFQPELAAGLGWRWGSGLPDSFSGAALRPFRQAALSADSLKNRWYFYGNVEARYRFDDLTIKGETHKPVPGVDVENGQMSAAVGVVYFYRSVGVGLSATANSKSFKQDEDNWHYRNALTFYWSF